jgi:hypothetical protein
MLAFLQAGIGCWSCMCTVLSESAGACVQLLVLLLLATCDVPAGLYCVVDKQQQQPSCYGVAVTHLHCCFCCSVLLKSYKGYHSCIATAFADFQ